VRRGGVKSRDQSVGHKSFSKDLNKQPFDTEQGQLRMVNSRMKFLLAELPGSA
jgi:hypothetical protein